MSERIIYPNAPSEEAVIDLRVASATQDASHLATLGDVLGDEYSLGHPIPKRALNRRKDDDHSQTDTDRTVPLGFRFTHRDKKQVFQARANGFVFSRLRPYDRWESFRDEARKLWNIYCNLHDFQSFTRVALRYINRIDMPEAEIELTDYFRIGPRLPEKFPYKGLNGIHMQLGIEQPDLGCILFLNVGRIEPPKPNLVSIMLDIDLFRMSEDGSALWQAGEQEHVWEYLEKLHTRKNEIFEACITDKTRELFR